MRIISSSEYYDQLSADYRQISQSRGAYLAGIDRLIAESLRPGLSLLDVGGADGVRSRRLAHDAGISRVTLLDSSPAMLSRVEPKNFEQIIEGDITSEATLAQLGEARFDAALILWNVLGHIPSPEARLRALANVHRALRPKGILFLDCQQPRKRACLWLADRAAKSQKPLAANAYALGDYHRDVQCGRFGRGGLQTIISVLGSTRFCRRLPLRRRDTRSTCSFRAQGTCAARASANPSLREL